MLGWCGWGGWCCVECVGFGKGSGLCDLEIEVVCGVFCEF